MLFTVFLHVVFFAYNFFGNNSGPMKDSLVMKHFNVGFKEIEKGASKDIRNQIFLYYDVNHENNPVNILKMCSIYAHFLLPCDFKEKSATDVDKFMKLWKDKKITQDLAVEFNRVEKGAESKNYEYAKNMNYLKSLLIKPISGNLKFAHTYRINMDVIDNECISSLKKNKKKWQFPHEFTFWNDDCSKLVFFLSKEEQKRDQDQRFYQQFDVGTNHHLALDDEQQLYLVKRYFKGFLADYHKISFKTDSLISMLALAKENRNKKIVPFKDTTFGSRYTFHFLD